MKAIKLRVETWQNLMRLKIDYEKRSIDETISMLINAFEEVRHARKTNRS